MAVIRANLSNAQSALHSLRYAESLLLSPKRLPLHLPSYLRMQLRNRTRPPTDLAITIRDCDLNSNADERNGDTAAFSL